MAKAPVQKEKAPVVVNIKVTAPIKLPKTNIVIEKNNLEAPVVLDPGSTPDNNPGKINETEKEHPKTLTASQDFEMDEVSAKHQKNQLLLMRECSEGLTTKRARRGTNHVQGN